MQNVPDYSTTDLLRPCPLDGALPPTLPFPPVAFRPTPFPPVVFRVVLPLTLLMDALLPTLGRFPRGGATSGSSSLLSPSSSRVIGSLSDPVGKAALSRRIEERRGLMAADAAEMDAVESGEAWCITMSSSIEASSGPA